MTGPEHPFRPSEPDQSAYVGYRPAPIPEHRDRLLDEYLATLRAGGPRAVATATAAASPDAREVLLRYGERAAVRAVRDRSVQLLVSGLVAVVVGGLQQGRAALLPMALLDDAGPRIGADPRDYFATAAEIVGNPGDINLHLWLARDPRDRTPASMGYAPVDGPDGFRYDEV